MGRLGLEPYPGLAGKIGQTHLLSRILQLVQGRLLPVTQLGRYLTRAGRAKVIIWSGAIGGECRARQTDLFLLAPLEGLAPPELSTGDPEDDQLLRQIAARAPLDQPRSWIHYIYAQDEPSAQIVARLLLRVAYQDAGFDVEIYAPDEADEPYCVVAEREGTVLTADLVRHTRELFKLVTSQVPGTEYDGWEVSMDTDEILEAIPDPDAPR